MEINVKSMTMAAITVAIAAIIVTTVMIPIVSEAQKVSGEGITYSNLETYPQGVYAKPIEVGDTLICNNGQITYNGVDVTTSAGQFPLYDGIVLCDKFGVRTGNESTLVTFLTSEAELKSYGGPVTITSNSEGTVKLERLGTVFYEGSYEFCYVACPAESATIWMSIGLGFGPGTKVYLSDISQINMAGMYTTGENDTGYWYYDGELHVSQDYPSSIELNMELAEGSTDIYTIDPVISIGSESFTPYYLIAPIEVTGHKDSGATYSLIGIIPLLVLTGLVIGVVGSFIRNRD